MSDDLFPELRTLADIGFYLRRVVAEWREPVEGSDASAGGGLPLAVAEPGPLMVQAVEAAGPDGLPRTALLQLFAPIGETGVQRGIDQMASSQRVLTCVVPTDDAPGRRRRHVVYRAIKFIE